MRDERWRDPEDAGRVEEDAGKDQDSDRPKGEPCALRKPAAPRVDEYDLQPENGQRDGGHVLEIGPDDLRP